MLPPQESRAFLPAICVNDRPKVEPMTIVNVSLADRQETSNAGFGCEQIVMAPIQLSGGQIVPNRKQIALPIIQKGEVHLRGKIPQSIGQMPLKTSPCQLFCGRRSRCDFGSEIVDRAKRSVTVVAFLCQQQAFGDRLPEALSV